MNNIVSSVVMLSIVVQSIIMLSALMQSVPMFYVVLLIVVTLSVVLHNDMTPTHRTLVVYINLHCFNKALTEML